MNIGMIIYSRTGNTLSVAERLKHALLDAGHTVTIDRVTAENDEPNAGGPARLTYVPQISAYDHVIMGAPVQAFSLSPVMKLYLSQLPQINGRKISCFVTEHFPKPWMGGRQAIKQMIRRISKVGGIVTETGIVNWMNKAREQQIAGVVTELSAFGS